ncbi:unnamed protein product [Caenorhabditis auriculariae]|uniref:Purple acid phosphatase n=1 Tax=Caenorhabditis auriculariae TaxID=2777116 RepID=A0A8S1GVG4_9PELO|nr:unnamed protein product [Caenorhabditis auriculariae]
MNWALVAFALTVSTVNGEKTVRHVHLSLSDDPTEMIVSWTTLRPLPGIVPYVNYGTSPSHLSEKVRASTVTWTDGGELKRVRYTHRAFLKYLHPGARYYYSAGSANEMSRVFSFFQPDGTRPLRAAVYGDVSLVNGFSIGPLVEAVKNAEFDLIIHLGDFAYDLGKENGSKGDAFMNALEPIMAEVPYMTIAGNHESEQNFLHYENRFTMPFNGFYQDNQFWSITIGVLHMIGISTEYYLTGRTYEVQTQYEWLKNDLQTNRGKWNVVFMHRPLYCSSKSPSGCNGEENTLPRDGKFGFPGLEALFNNEGVDMVFWGHEHTYERLWPVFKSKPFVGSDLHELLVVMIICILTKRSPNLSRPFDLAITAMSCSRLTTQLI